MFKLILRVYQYFSEQLVIVDILYALINVLQTVFRLDSCLKICILHSLFKCLYILGGIVGRIDPATFPLLSPYLSSDERPAICLRISTD